MKAWRFVALLALATVPSLANERFGLSMTDADAKWPVKLGQPSATETAGIHIKAQRYAVGTWQLTVYFYDGKSEALEYQKRGAGGRASVLDEDEIESLLKLFGIYISSEQRAIYRSQPGVREWHSDDAHAFYDPAEFTLRVFSTRGLETYALATKRAAQERTKGL